MAESRILTCSTEKLPEAINFLREALKRKKSPSKDIARALLASEEVIAKLISNAPDSREELKISVSGMLGNIMGIRIYFSILVNAFAFSLLFAGIRFLTKREEIDIDVYGDRATVTEYSSDFFKDK